MEGGYDVPELSGWQFIPMAFTMWGLRVLGTCEQHLKTKHYPQFGQTKAQLSGPGNNGAQRGHDIF